MSAPKCKLCAKNHYGSCNPRDLPDIKENVKPSESIENDSHLEKPLPQKPQTVNENHASIREQETEAKRQWRGNNRAKYNEYMREYMRRRRSIVK